MSTPVLRMFVEVEQKERVSIPVSQEAIADSVLAALTRKCSGVHTKAGVLLFPTKLTSISDVSMAEGRLYPLVVYQVVMYRVYPGEILLCTIEKQSPAGIHLTHPLIPSVLVPAVQLPAPSEFKTIAKKGGKCAEMWGWTYEGTVLYFQVGDTCRVRVISSDHSPSLVCAMGEAGLGPSSWW